VLLAGRSFVLVAVALIVLVLLAGIVIYVNQLGVAAEALEVEKINVVDIDVEPGFFNPKHVVLTFSITIRNPTEYGFEVESITYKVYIGDDFLGEGSKKNIYIPPKTSQEILLELTIPLETLGQTIRDAVITAVKTGHLQVKLTGNITIPLKAYGLKLASTTIPYEETIAYKLCKTC